MRQKITTTVIAVCGILIAFGPMVIFPVCKITEGMPVMKCFWMARAELAVGLSIFILAVLSFIPSFKTSAKGINAAIVLNGIMTILLPTVLIGVCKHPHMRCRAVSFPVLVILGSIVILLAVLNTLDFKKCPKN